MRKSELQTISTIFGGLLGFALAVWGFIMVITSALSLVPPGEYAGLIKLAVGFVLFTTFGGLAVFVAILLGLLFAWLGSLIFG